VGLARPPLSGRKLVRSEPVQGSLQAVRSGQVLVPLPGRHPVRRVPPFSCVRVVFVMFFHFVFAGEFFAGELKRKEKRCFCSYTRVFCCGSCNTTMHRALRCWLVASLMFFQRGCCAVVFHSKAQNVGDIVPATLPPRARFHRPPLTPARTDLIRHPLHLLQGIPQRPPPRRRGSPRVTRIAWARRR